MASTSQNTETRTPVPVEPSAAMRRMANLVRGVYVSLLEAGFTEQEALAMTTPAITELFHR